MESLATTVLPAARELGNPQRTRVPTFPQRRRLRLLKVGQLLKPAPIVAFLQILVQNVKKILPAPLRDAGVVTYIQPHLIPHLILRGVIGLVALARRTFPRRCQPQLLVPTRRFHEVSGARRRSVTKLRKLKRWLKCQP